jgi:hypothetical protein
MNPGGLILVAVGIFALSGAIFDWEWFMNNRKARLFVTILSRTGARIFYGLLGSGFVVAGILFAMGIIKDSN